MCQYRSDNKVKSVSIYQNIGGKQVYTIPEFDR